MKKRAILVLVLNFLCGCALHSPKLYKPSTPAVVSDQYSIEQYQQDKKAYSEAITAQQFETAQLIRNRMIYNQKFAADNVYEEYAAGLGALRASAGTFSDVLQSSVSGVGIILGTERAKELLAAAGLWTQAFERSVKSRYHGDVSPEVFI